MLKLTQVICVLLFLLNIAPLARAQTSDPGQKLMRQGNYLLQEANDLEQAAQQQLQESNRIRQQLLQARREPSTTNNAVARGLAQQLNTLQQQGSLLRLQAESRLNEAKQQLARGLQVLWPQWASITEPFSASSLANTDELPVRAHNTVERSVHPGIQDDGATRLATEQQADMSLTINTRAAQNQPQDIDRTTFQLSKNQLLIGHIEAPDTGAINNNKIPINKIHRWHLVVSDLQGNPIQGANIRFVGHMPGHVHGLPTQPVVGAEISPGVYPVEGVKFQMQGWWVIDFEITSGNASDILRFNLVL